MSQKHKKILFAWFQVVVIVTIIALLSRGQYRPTADYMFAVFANTGWLFSALLGGIFVAGVYVLLDRAGFFICHKLISGKLHLSDATGSNNVYDVFLQTARDFRATSEEGVYSDDIVARARQTALGRAFDDQELDWGRSWLEFLGTVAPTVGFMGTLVGLIDSFQKLGMGGQLMEVLEGLALSMTTSLLGAIISLVFLSAAWMLGRAREAFDEQLEHLIAKAQQNDRLGV